jgi:hypothetical protein
MVGERPGRRPAERCFGDRAPGTLICTCKRLKGVSMHPVLDRFRYKLPFMIAGFSSMVLAIYLYFVQDEQMAGIFVGLWVPSIHSLGTLVLSGNPPEATATSSDDRNVRSEARS